jgi:aspartate oxidase
MGGISIDAEGNVLNASGEIIHGLHAAGEVSGGVHGVNRLAGNSLLECTVYGTIVGKKIPIRHTSFSSFAAAEPPSSSTPSQANKEKRKITKTELSQHNTPEDCWVAIHGVVYDLTDFADEHPAGAASVHELAGQDGTEAFAAVHNVRMLEDFDEEIKGEYAS